MNLSTTTTDAAKIANLPASLADFDEGEDPIDGHPIAGRGPPIGRLR